MIEPSFFPGDYPENAIFVFGSNWAGRHGAGAALHAKQHWGAMQGVGMGRTGKAYALPTKDANIKTLELSRIYFGSVLPWQKYVKEHPELLFLMTKVGCGLAGYTVEQVGPLFRGTSHPNIIWPNEFKVYL